MRTLISIVLLFITIISCKQDTEPKNTDSIDVGTLELIEKEEPTEGIEFYSWLDNLNLRELPHLNARVVTKVNPQDKLVKTGNKSTNELVLVLRGIAYKDFWYEVKTPEDKTAWVFGGAIKTLKEEKGNKPVSELRFSFPAFGDYNLSKWNKLNEESFTAGDAESTVLTYQEPSAKQKMIITKTDVGEYGYFIKHDLFGMNNKPLLSREVHFDNESKTLTEAVITHNIYPKRKASRTQEIGVSYSELNSRPIIALGDWSFEDVE